MNAPAIPAFLQEAATAFGQTEKVEAVTWCGSSAMGKADRHSDYDLYVYTRFPVPLEQRAAVIAERAKESQLDNLFWELEDEWIDQSGRHFNAMYRACDYVLAEIEERLDRHTAQLGYTTAYCFSVANGFILYDARGWLRSVQERLRQPFPAGLVRSIIARNRPVLGVGMLSCYFAQIRAAITRRDPISLNHRTAVWIASYTDIVFAINRRYHPGEKRVLSYLADLPSLPANALEDLVHLCAMAGRLDSPIAEHITTMLGRLDEWIAGK